MTYIVSGGALNSTHSLTSENIKRSRDLSASLQSVGTIFGNSLESSVELSADRPQTAGLVIQPF